MSTPSDTRPAADTGDAHAADRATGVPEALRDLHDTGVLDNADVHTAVALLEMTGDAERPEADHVLVGFSLAVRAMRHGHVAFDLRSGTGMVPDPDATAATALDDVPVALVRSAVASSDGVVRAADVHAGNAQQPFVLDGDLLALRRLHDAQQAVADGVRRRLDRPARTISRQERDALFRLLPNPPGGTSREQQAAARVVLERGFAVLAGGPGTGKTSTLGAIVALLDERWRTDHGRAPDVALAAPTGRAARRMGEAVAEWLATADVADDTREHLAALRPTTLHRLLGRRRGSTEPAHHAGSPLPHEVVVVDEASMADVVLLGQLFDACTDDTVLLLVGDPAQLASVEAGSVLADLVGPRQHDARATARDDGSRRTAVHEVVTVLTRTHRFDSSQRIGELARAVADGDGDEAVAVLRRSQHSQHDATVGWVEVDAAVDDLSGLRDELLDDVVEAHRAAEAGDAVAALAAVERVRLLVAHRRGPYGVARLDAVVGGWLRERVEVLGDVGLPVLVTRRHRREGLDNGDVGVVVRGGDGVARAVFGGDRTVARARLADALVTHAMTIHRAQGSQHDRVVVVLPDAASRLMSRQLLYTAVTRARQRVVVVGTEEQLRAGVARRVDRVSGLRRQLWTPQMVIGTTSGWPGR